MMKKAFGIDKIERFLLCENTMRNAQQGINRQFILHTREPLMLIQIHWMDELNEPVNSTSIDPCNVSTWINVQDEAGISNEVELIFRVIYLWDDEFEKDELTKIVKRAIDWYLASLDVSD